ncbi:MAG: class I SAM-dependent methyltransferase [Dehalococcoidia bacterium]|nr:MAG: class I SAM-dependent methyltransferase [Dehalococcoidia bacterium]TEU16355.1 MAG: class I SAM-dependent methyltransferase [Dehalococcoidia bacterium]
MDSLFEYRSCPNCGRDDFTVTFDSNMGEADLQKGIKTVYMLWEDTHGRYVKCKNCHLIYVNPIEKASKINGDYSKMGNTDAPIIRGSRLRAAKSQLGLIKKYKSGTTLLDIGCGEGFFLFNASKAGYTTKGIEISQDAAEYAGREFGLDVEAKPFEELQFPDNYFDVVTLWQVLEHVPYPLIVLKEVHRILKPEGLLATSTPDIESILAKILRRKWWNLRRLHINQFTAKTLTDMLKRAGFKNVFSTKYKEHISISMLVIPLLKHLKMYERAESRFYPSSTSGKIMNKLTLVYSSRLDNCTVIGFK